MGHRDVLAAGLLSLTDPVLMNLALSISSLYAAKIWTKKITEKRNFNVINMNQADNAPAKILRVHCFMK